MGVQKEEENSNKENLPIIYIHIQHVPDIILSRYDTYHDPHIVNQIVDSNITSQTETGNRKKFYFGVSGHVSRGSISPLHTYSTWPLPALLREKPVRRSFSIDQVDIRSDLEEGGTLLVIRSE